MYAQLCKKLSEETPNFDDPNGPCTFNRLLLNKCQDEFERRWRAREVWDSSDRALTQEEEEQKAAARRKMVGNLRFIGELGKLEIIHESILHRCIQQLIANYEYQLVEKRRRSVSDMAEDLECLCQMMKTCGKVLDKPKAKYLMDQYFERMSQLRMNLDLPSRIRFMLQDVLELRQANWVPRKIAQMDGPRTIQQVREEAARDLGVYIPPPSSQGQPRSSGPISPLSGMPSFFPQVTITGGLRTGMEDVFGVPLGPGTLGTGPGVISSQPDKFSYDTNGFTANTANRDTAFRARQPPGSYTQHNFYQNKHFNNQSYNRQQQNNQFNQQQNNYTNTTNHDLAPRFKKMLTTGDEVSLRPSAMMSLSPKTPGVLPQSALDCSHHNDGPHSGLPLAPQPQPPNQKPTLPCLHKDTPILIKQASAEKPRASKREKGPRREDYLERVKVCLFTHMEEPYTSETMECYKNIKVPDRLSADAAHSIIFNLLHYDEAKQQVAYHLLTALKVENLISSKCFFEGLKKVLDELEDLVVDIPRVKCFLAGIIGYFINSDMMTLSEVAEPLDGGDHFPLIFLILQTLHKLQGSNELSHTFIESKVNLLNLLPESDRTKEKLTDLLEDRELSFLFPLLRIQANLWSTLVADPSPHSFYKYIKDNLDVEHHTAPGFITALVTVLIKYITQETTLPEGADPTTVPEKAVNEQERELLGRFKQVLQAFLHDHPSLQVIAVYSLQVFCHTNNFPKGMLLRWFMYFYDLEIVEEDAFLTWKEDLSQDYPGKGKALFQVNQWLTWLQETEEDEEEDEGEA